MVRLKDVAARAGVSLVTVSKVLRDAPDISAPTKIRVRRLAAEMGYVPNSSARCLRGATTRLFGLVLAAATHPHAALILTALEEQTHRLGYDLILAHSLDLPEREEVVIRRLLSRRVDGLFLCPVYRLEPHALIYGELATRGTPTVILGPHAPFCEPFPGVEVDDMAASSQVTRHLLQLGHRRIAFFAGPQILPAARERLEGYRRALRGAQVPWDDRLIFNAGSTLEEGGHAARQMLAEAPQATAVQAFDDLVALGAANVFLDQGLRLPRDLSITGFGNLLLSEHFRVPLTTVRQPGMRLGLAAAELMQQLLAGRTAPSQRLAADLVVRASSGPAPASAPLVARAG
ncbi:MAG: LacI family DNA-binding transcriptional regulator [Verrucomicrobia bacterium]|nr:LacI family DNA-binding transcriptional regulator [Verrucomicrobiota bacterium]